ncbi:MAG: tRNA (adenosine(37)-N6)-dimethylallyltransferase MiaA [Limnohabitans sp.]|nr:tRNA (adenosine(37)-N6)-dimethylallyltransferase MiaA [Limnohabitans sp.]
MVIQVQQSNHPHAFNAIGLAGPTASGKTAIALEIAKHWSIEIISVDSALVYKGMDIGTAKPSPQILNSVPHHLIDIREPTHAYSAAEFVKDASHCIEQIQSRGRIPLLVGGTMLYFKALRDGLDDLPVANPLVRMRIEDEAKQKSWPSMHTQLATIDPATAVRLPPHDAQRISRALEVFEITGQTLSSLFGKTSKTSMDLPLISLEPQSRAWLHQRIEQRFTQMLGDGFIAELHQLRQRGDLHPDLPSMRCVGYRQGWQVMDKNLNDDIPLSPEQIKKWHELGVIASRQLAKRQLTWLKSMPHRHIVDSDGPKVTEQILKTMDNFIHIQKSNVK